MSVLVRVREFGNVAEACRQRGLDRTRFHEGKRRFRTQGLDGLKDRPAIGKSHPQTTPPETVERIKALALDHRTYGDIAAPVAISRSIASSPSPASASTSRVCSPSNGAGRAMAPGVAENLTGRPTVFTRPATG